MSPILKRLEQSFPGLQIEPIHSKAAIAVCINALSNKSRADLMLHHAKINFEYNVLCSKIALEFNSPTANHERREQMQAALKTAELLEIINCYYIDVPREVARLRKEQRLISQWLNLVQVPANDQTQETYASEYIRRNTGFLNFPRFIAVRLRRLLVAISAIVNESSSYRESMNNIDRYAAPSLSIIACVYFIPRTSNNIAMMLKHTIKHPWMTDEEKKLDWQTRFRIQFNSRWQDLSNDLPWMTANCVGALVLIGPLLPWAIVFAISMQLYEVIQTSIVYLIDQHNLKLQREDYEKLLLDTAPDSDEHNKIKSYITELDARINYEKTRLWLPIRNALVLLLAISLAAPIFAPGFAIVGGIIAVLITLYGYYARIEHEKTKPAGNLFELLSSPAALKSMPTQTGTPSNTGLFRPKDIYEKSDNSFLSIIQTRDPLI